MHPLIKKILRPPYRMIVDFFHDCHIRRQTKTLAKLQSGKKRIFYLGVTMHSNLGDLAQYHCIGKWLRANYPEHEIVELEAETVVSRRFGFMDLFRKALKPDDLIFFQSGYTTQDLGGLHDEMHRLIATEFPEQPMVMMPQTVFFVHEENRRRTALACNRARKMLFLARDRISFEQARAMFPDLAVHLYPDIVTSLIGKYHFDSPREKVLFCCRNDGEKKYSDEEIANLRKKLAAFVETELSDTTVPVRATELRKHLQHYLEEIFRRYSRYRAIVTDRYHGTIFSLIAETPVLILKTTDHKVITGAEWFRGVYDDRVYTAETLDDVEPILRKILQNPPQGKTDDYFERNYYRKLKALIESSILAKEEK